MQRKSTSSIIVNVFLWFFSTIGAMSIIYLALLWVVNLSRSNRMTHLENPLQPATTATAVELRTELPEIDNFVQELFLSPPQCQLPCWWGFTPGKTTLKEMDTFLATYASNRVAQPARNGVPSLALVQIGGQEFGLPQIDIVFQDEVLTNITLEGLSQEYAKSYFLPEVLKTYGTPSQVCALPYDEKYLPVDDGASGSFIQENSDPSKLILLLSYQERGIEITYKFKGSETCCMMKASLGLPESVRLILQKEQTSQLPSAEITCEGKQYIPGKSAAFNPPPSSGFRPIEEVADLNVDTFYQRFLMMQQEQDWIQISTRAWKEENP